MDDIFKVRSEVAAIRSKERKSCGYELADECITKPSPFLSIRDIVARYSRGEIVSVPEKSLEVPVIDDVVEHLDPYHSDLDMRQRVYDFTKEYEEAKEARNAADAADKSGNISRSPETLSEGSPASNDA